MLSAFESHRNRGMKFHDNIHSSGMSPVSSLYTHHEYKKEGFVRDFSNPFAFRNLVAELEDRPYGSVTEDIKALSARWKAIENSNLALVHAQARERQKFPIPQAFSKSPINHIPPSTVSEVSCYSPSGVFGKSPRQRGIFIADNVIDLEVELNANDIINKEGRDAETIVISDSDEESVQNMDVDGIIADEGRYSHDWRGHNTPFGGGIGKYGNKTEILASQDLYDTPILELSQHESHGKFGAAGFYRSSYASVLPLGNISSEQIFQRFGTCLPFCNQHQLDILKANIFDQKPAEVSMVDDHCGNKGAVLEDEKLKEETKDMERDTEIMGSSYGCFETEVLGIESNGTDGDGNTELDDLWNEMAMAMECSKSVPLDNPAIEKKGEDCNHDFDLEDDLGLVCKHCGVIRKGIETIFEFQWGKGSRNTRASMIDSRSPMSIIDQVKSTELYVDQEVEDDPIIDNISIHPRHMNVMKSHQLEGFRFMQGNLLTDSPGGCILAHAPGSGKTFLIISFIQSFLTSYPHARPLIILPKGIISTWMREFKKWQVEEIPLLDMYTPGKSDARSDQLKALKRWKENKSILFLGYQQFASIVFDDHRNPVTKECQDLLLNEPGLLILDEGHTPRNEDTDVLQSLMKVKTARKVVLSGTLFQNHVKEVFNILNLVRPNFLKRKDSRQIVKRILSRVHVSSGSKKNWRDNNTFYELVEETLQSEDLQRKIMVIQDLRELTHNVLHYYKGDFLEELPGLLDFTVILNLTESQKNAVRRLGELEGTYKKAKFKKDAVGTAIYMHPSLEDLSKTAATKKRGAEESVSMERIEEIIREIDINDGVKTNFFLSLLSFAESAGEKVLVFSQYRLPLNFLAKLTANRRGWRLGREFFEISGKSSFEDRERAMDQFNNSRDAKVLFGSIKACGEGISLVGATRVLILDVHINPSVTRQAIGRAFRPGQSKKVYTYRLVASGSREEEDHVTSFKKELISKMWFEWTGLCSRQAFQMNEVALDDCDDLFLENSLLGEYVKILYKR